MGTVAPAITRVFPIAAFGLVYRRMRHIIVTLGLVAACSSPSTPPPTKPDAADVKSCAVVLESRGATGVAGEFNDWAEVAFDDGELSLGDLPPGDYAYALVTDGERERPPTNTFTKWVDGVEYRALRVGDCAVPEWRVESADISVGRLEAEFAFVSASGGATLDPDSIVARAGAIDLPTMVDVETGRVSVSFELPTPGKYTVHLSASDVDGKSADLWLPMWFENEPFVWQDALLYLVFTDRFRDADGSGGDQPTGVAPIASYQGGDFAGVTQAIKDGYFADLGVNSLWLSPVYENPDGGFIGADGVNNFVGYHGYWPVDSLIAETRFGGDEALHELIREAHARGMRIVFDIVLNHVHEDHPYCTETPEFCATTCVCGTPGCGYDEKPRECQFAPYLPDLDYRNHAIVQRVTADVLELTRKFDVDALRIDAAKHMDHVIMRTLRLRLAELEAQGAAPFWLIGETFTFDRGEIMQYVNDTELHGQFDFPLFGAIRGVFAQGGSFRDLEGAAAASQREYGKHYSWMSPFLGNHDVERFATLWAGNSEGGFGNTPDLMADGTTEITQWDLINRLSMAFAFLLTQPGIPLVYYGDEVGLAGAGDPDNRRFMPGTLNANRQELLARVQQIGQLRGEITALRRGGRKELWINDDMYVYVRDAGPGEVAIVAMNKGSGAQTAEVQVPSALGLTGAMLTSRNSDRSARIIDGVFSLTLDPWEYVILTP